MGNPARGSLSMASITHDRLELKYKVSNASANALARRLSLHVTEHHFQAESESHLPQAEHYVTTVYFDTPSLDLYRAACSAADNLKIRAREYYDLQYELGRRADSGELVRHSPVLWLELKRRQAGRTYKRRIGIPKIDVSAFFERGAVSPAMRALQARQRGADAENVIDDLLQLRARLSTPLRPSCMVNYCRTAFQNAAGTVRITLDQRLACFAPPRDLLLQPTPLVREHLGRPLYEEQSCILEVKLTGELPTWLDELLRHSQGERLAFSKFVTASKAVLASGYAKQPSIP